MPFFVDGSRTVTSSVKLPDEIAFSMGSLSVYWYGVLLAAALLTALLLIQVESRRKRMGPDLATDLCLVAIPSGIVGARLWYVAAFWDAFRANPASALHIWDGGLSVYGALLFGTAGVLVYTAVKKISLPKLLDTIAPALALSPGIAVWGDYFNQQGYGPEITERSLEWFPFAVLIQRTGTIHYAAFFYEFLFCVLLFLFLWLFLRKTARRDGVVFFVCLLLFSLGHGLTEQLRVDAPCLYGSLKTGTVVCAALFVLSGIALFLMMKKPLSPSPEQADPPICGEDDHVKTVENNIAPPEDPPDEPAQPAAADQDNENSEDSDHA